MGLLRRGLAGEPVRVLQEKLGVTADGIFGPSTEAALVQYQKDNGLSADGIAGPDTFTAMGLLELVLLHRPLRGEMVRKLQEGLGIGADGVFGAGTEAAVKALQTQNGLVADGVAGPQTLAFVPGFEMPQATVELSLVSETTPTIDDAAVEEAKQTVGPPPQDPSFFELATTPYRAAGAAVASVGKSIWSTVRNIF